VAEPEAISETADRYTVDVRSEDRGWSVAIVDAGTEVSVRACRSEEEARTYASTVRQHLRWLSPSKFREYYRLHEEA
jgi:hypothetical protein